MNVMIMQMFLEPNYILVTKIVVSIFGPDQTCIFLNDF